MWRLQKGKKKCTNKPCRSIYCFFVHINTISHSTRCKQLLCLQAYHWEKKMANLWWSMYSLELHGYCREKTILYRESSLEEKYALTVYIPWNSGILSLVRVYLAVKQSTLLVTGAFSSQLQLNILLPDNLTAQVPSLWLYQYTSVGSMPSPEFEITSLPNNIKLYWGSELTHYYKVQPAETTYW